MALKRRKNNLNNKINNQKTNLMFSSGRCLASKSNHAAVLRIIDANLNRCREGLRVVEDSLRFILNDGKFYKRIRAIRHNTDKLLRDIYGDIIKERDSFDDSGRELKENTRKNLVAIIVANFKRAQESLRILEEYSKNFFPEVSQEFKKQRYKAYIEEKAIYLKYKDIFIKK
jgi:thiamine-phosphate pyrophosphorylase